jgi:hypothetical protein
MSTWTNVTDTVLEPGQPIRSVDIIAIKNNILAVPDGAANAPRVQTNAIENLAVTLNKIISPTSGTSFIVGRVNGSGELSNTSNGYPNASQFKIINARNQTFNCINSGVIRCELQHRKLAGGTNSDSFVRILRNGSNLQEWSTGSTGFVSRSLNVTVAVGDVISFQQRVRVSGTVAMRNLLIRSNVNIFAGA